MERTQKKFQTQFTRGATDQKCYGRSVGGQAGVGVGVAACQGAARCMSVEQTVVHLKDVVSPPPSHCTVLSVY